MTGQKRKGIVYCLFEKNDGDEQEILLDPKYRVNYNKSNNTIYIQENDRYIPDFWGGSVNSCIAVVGENGAGKTMLMHSIMALLITLKHKGYYLRDGLVIYEGQEEGLVVVTTEKYNKINVWTKNNIYYEIQNNDSKNALIGFKVMYFHNTLCDLDYYRYPANGLYDFSLGRLISKYYAHTQERENNNCAESQIVQYFAEEYQQIIDFIYEYVLNGTLNIPFPIPKEFQIKVYDRYQDIQYLANSAKAIRVDRDEEEQLSQEMDDFIEVLIQFERSYERSWINGTVKKILINCFWKSCISDAGTKKMNDTHEVFFKAFRKMQKRILKQDIYKCAIEVLENVEKLMENGNYISEEVYDMDELRIALLHESVIGRSIRFIRWLRKNEKALRKFEKVEDSEELIIPINKTTQELVQQLLLCYKMITYEFPVYEFSFGVSTGEFHFLSLFSKLYSTRHGGENSPYPKLYNCENILLIFDEADLSLHPRWQRMYMKWLTDFCNELFDGMYVNIVVTTHSPILLSDFPRDNVIYLKKDGDGHTTSCQREKNTFASNIHSLYLDSFFLDRDGTMGAFAENKINNLVQTLLEKKMPKNKTEDCAKVMRYIGEDIIKDKLQRMYDQYNDGKNDQKRIVYQKNDTVIKDTLEKLKAQRKA